MPRPILPFLLLPYFRLELPGWGPIFRAAGGFRDELWAGAPTRSIRGKYHGYRMDLRLSNWSERQTFFLGRFYDLPMQLLLREFLRPGDAVVDVGGNIGMIALVAARMVGPTGRVVVFEPNPDAFAILEATVEANDLGDVVQLQPLAASDEGGEAELKVITDHTGMGTLADVGDIEAGLVTRRHRIRAARGDEILADLPEIAMVKIDVEGFEVRALRGLRDTLTRCRPVVAAEVVADHLVRAGASVEQLFSFMDDLGFRPFGLTTERRGLRHRLRLEPASASDPDLPNNVVWLNPEGRYAGRLTGLLDGAIHPDDAS